MADSFLDNAGGFTPVPDKLVRDYGFEVAYVWGKVWRYCQMQNGACTASHETIAKRAGMSRRTLIDKLNILIEAGYIEDKTPDLKNKPHTYCTRIGEDKITSAMQISHTESDMPSQDNELGMRNLHSDNADNAQSNLSTMQNLHSTYAGIAQPTMQNLHLKKDSKKPLKETTTRDAAAQKLETIYLSGANGKATQSGVDLVNDMLNTYPAEVIIYACGEAEKNTTPSDDKRNLKYIEAVCKRKVSGQPDKRKDTNGHLYPSQNHPRPDPQFESGGLSETSKALAAAWNRKRRRSGNDP